MTSVNGTDKSSQSMFGYVLGGFVIPHIGSLIFVQTNTFLTKCQDLIISKIDTGLAKLGVTDDFKANAIMIAEHAIKEFHTLEQPLIEFASAGLIEFAKGVDVSRPKYAFKWTADDAYYHDYHSIEEQLIERVRKISDEQEALEIISDKPFAFRHLSQNLRDNFNVATLALSRYWLTVHDCESVTQSNMFFIRSVLEETKNYDLLIYMLSHYYYNAIPDYARSVNEFVKDPKFVSDAVESSIEIINELLQDKNFIIEAVKHNYGIFRLMPDPIREDEEFALAAISADSRAYFYVRNKLADDVNFIIKALQVGLYPYYIDILALKDRRLLRAALETGYRFVLDTIQALQYLANKEPGTYEPYEYSNTLVDSKIPGVHDKIKALAKELTRTKLWFDPELGPICSRECLRQGGFSDRFQEANVKLEGAVRQAFSEHQSKIENITESAELTRIQEKIENPKSEFWQWAKEEIQNGVEHCGQMLEQSQASLQAKLGNLPGISAGFTAQCTTFFGQLSASVRSCKTEIVDGLMACCTRVDPEDEITVR